MEHSYSVETLVAKIQICIDLQKPSVFQRTTQLVQLILKREMPSEIVLEAILQMFELKIYGYEGQKHLVILLEKCNPTPHISLEMILQRCFQSWDVSLYQLPFWINKHFSLQEIHECFQKFEGTDFFREHEFQFNACVFWLKRRGWFSA